MQSFLTNNYNDQLHDCSHKKFYLYCFILFEMFKLITKIVLTKGDKYAIFFLKGRLFYSCKKTT
jgi:hypothetical protein